MRAEIEKKIVLLILWIDHISGNEIKNFVPIDSAFSFRQTSTIIIIIIIFL